MNSGDASRIQELSGFLTESRFRKFRDVLSQRTRFVSVVLEDLYDPHNGSACLRSCEACGIQEVHIVEERNAFMTVEGVTMGSARWLDLRRHYSPDAEGNAMLSDEHSGTSIGQCYAGLRDRGYTIVAMTPHPAAEKAVAFDRLPLSGPVAVVFGSERDGLSETAMNEADLHTRLPIHGFVESYNISVACALTVFHLAGRIRNELLPEQWQLSGEDHDSVLLSWLRRSIRNVELVERSLSSEPRVEP